MYCLFCVVLCIVCVYMCTELLPPGGYPVAVKYIISYKNFISYNARDMDDIELHDNNLRQTACTSASCKNSTVDKTSLYSLQVQKTILE